MLEKAQCPETMSKNNGAWEKTMPRNNVKKSQCLINKKRGLRLELTLLWKTFSSFFKLHVAPLEIASKTKFERKESRALRNKNNKQQEAKCQAQEKKAPKVKKIEHHILI